MTERRKKREPKGHYSVGYCKPPDTAKWGPGQSRNPSGRPKVPPSIEDIFIAQAMKLVAIKSGDQVTKVTKMEAVIMAILNKAANGHPQLAAQALDEYRKAQADAAKRANTAPKVDFSWTEEQAALLKEIEKIAQEVGLDPPDSH